MLNKGILLAGKEKLYNVYRGTVSHVSLSYSPQTDIKAGTRVNITVNANSGYQNPSVSVTKNDGTGSVTVSGSGSSRYFTMPKSDVTINASASLIPTYSVSGSASGGGISFSKTSGIRAGETVTVYLSPNSYHTLSSLTSSPSVSFSGSGNTRTFRMPSSNVRVTATFGKNYNFAVQVDSYNGYQYGKYLGSGAILENSTGWDIQVFATNYKDSPVTTEFRSYSSGVPSTLTLCRLDTNFTMTFSKSNYHRTEGAFFQTSDVGKTLYIKIM